MTTKVEPTVEKKLKYVRCTECVECRKLLTEEMLERFDKIFYGRDYFTNSDSYEEVKKFIKEEYEKSEIVTHPARFCCNDDFTPISPTVEKWEREFDEKFDYRHYDDANEKWLSILDRKDYNPASTEQMKDFIRHSVQEAKAEMVEKIKKHIQQSLLETELQTIPVFAGEIVLWLASLKQEKSLEVNKGGV